MALWAGGHCTGDSALLHVHLRVNVLRGPDVVTARLQALQIVQGAMALVDLFRIKARFLKLPVHIAGEYCCTEWHGVCPALEDCKPGMWQRLSVEG